MIVAVGLIVSKIYRGQRSEGSGRNKTDRRLSLNAIRTTELECILNGLPWRWIALSECF